ncbi:uncharacterized protein TNCV_4081111 [Trichonephila clavipes]|nr:uncharacterized protein TNCV_4081111 [Trichonephila clavipes]
MSALLRPTLPQLRTIHVTITCRCISDVKLQCIVSIGCGSPAVKVSDHGRHLMSSSPVPPKTRRVGQRCTLNLSRAESSSRWYGSCDRGVLAQVSSASLDHGSKLRGPSPKSLV